MSHTITPLMWCCLTPDRRAASDPTTATVRHMKLTHRHRHTGMFCVRDSVVNKNRQSDVHVTVPPGKCARSWCAQHTFDQIVCKVSNFVWTQVSNLLTKY